MYIYVLHRLYYYSVLKELGFSNIMVCFICRNYYKSAILKKILHLKMKIRNVLTLKFFWNWISFFCKTQKKIFWRTVATKLNCWPLTSIVNKNKNVYFWEWRLQCSTEESRSDWLGTSRVNWLPTFQFCESHEPQKTCIFVNSVMHRRSL